MFLYFAILTLQICDKKYYLRAMNRTKIFNPEHDMALANGDRHFIAPRNIREMARDLTPLLEVMDEEDIMVWGWGHAIKSHLLRMGIANDMLPTDDALTALRTCSERKSAHHLLRAFHADHPNGPYIGESILAHNMGDIAAYATRHGHIILKDPLSSSGKGLRHVKEHQETHLNPPCEGGLEAQGGGTPEDSGAIPKESPQDSLEHSKKHCPSKVGGRAEHNEMEQSGGGMYSSLSLLKKVESWANALIKRHGYLTAEPYYNKVQDFAMEFCLRDGQCHFIGYSLFNTNHHGRYESNLLMADEKIEELLAQYIPHPALHEVRDWVITHTDRFIPTEWNTAKYPLYFGIDMMIVQTKFTIHNSQFTIDKVCASERDVSLLTNRPASAAELKTEFNSQFTIDKISDNSPLNEDKNNHPEAHCQLSIVNCQFNLHPCVEINLRLNMGIIAHEVRRKLLASGTEGTFHVTAFPTEEAAQQFHQEQTTKYPPVYREGKIVSGYHPLTPILPHTRHHAYVVCEAKR